MGGYRDQVGFHVDENSKRSTCQRIEEPSRRAGRFVKLLPTPILYRLDAGFENRIPPLDEIPLRRFDGHIRRDPKFPTNSVPSGRGRASRPPEVPAAGEI